MALTDLLNQLQQNAAASEMRRVAAQKSIAQAAQQHQAAMAASANSGGWAPNPTAGDNAKKPPVAVGGSSASGSAPLPTGKIDPYASMRTMKFGGMSYTVNSTAAKRFQGLLRDLKKNGYMPSSIGGFSNRNIAGTNTKSLHSYGLAIDIDPSKNPVTWDGKNITALPSNVGQLAKKHGLAWGGDWNGSKKDTMHFSVPYFGTK